MKITDASPKDFSAIPPEDGGAADPAPRPRPKYQTKLIHPSYIVEPCINCGFPEADGGYCAECGWSLPHPFRKDR